MAEACPPGSYGRQLTYEPRAPRPGPRETFQGEHRSHPRSRTGRSWWGAISAAFTRANLVGSCGWGAMGGAIQTVGIWDSLSVDYRKLDQEAR